MANDKLELIALGGAGEIGKSMTSIRYRNQLLIIDTGIAFPSDDLYGVDVVIPDITYLLEHKDEIQGIVLTHGHEDHVGGLGYVLAELDVPVYGTELTLALTKPKIAEKGLGINPKYNCIKPNETFFCGLFEIEAVRVTHSIPETCAVMVRTPLGTIAFTGDFKFDHTPVDGKLSNIKRLKEIGDEGVCLMLSDCTNVERPGWGPSERSVGRELNKIISKAPGRVLVTTFASNIHRIQQVMDSARQYNRKIAVAGRRMEQNIEIARELGYIKYPSDLRIRIQEVDILAPDRVVILTTGSQGEPLSALSLMAQDDYSRLKIQHGDTIVISATPIPGNEDLIWRTVNRLVRQGADVIYSSLAPVHASGHAYREELRLMLNLLRPYYIAPLHGEPRHQALYRELAMDEGYSAQQIFTMENGDTLVIEDHAAYKGDRVPAGRVLIDSAGYSGVSDEVIRDRRHMASDGVVMALINLSAETGELIAEPDFVTKGFVFADNDALNEAKQLIIDLLNDLSEAEKTDSEALKDEIGRQVKKLLRKKTQSRPLVVPVIIEL